LQIKKGSRRIVILFPELGFVLKLPRIRLKSFLKQIPYTITKKEVIKKELFKWTVDTHATMRQYIFLGIASNWREFVFYRQTRHPFCVPTLFSFFGLFNLQKYVTICSFKPDTLWCQFQELTNCHMFDFGSHHFTMPENFTFESGKIMMLDYGDLKVHEFIRKHGEMVMEKFDPNYNWENRKAELEKEK
jgi:hypothetical protein